MTAMCTAAANYLIERTNKFNNEENRLYKDRVFMTSKRLQKLLYFSDVIYMQRNNGKSMFSDEFYAWPSGPVIPSVYSQFKHFQEGEMTPICRENTSLYPCMINALDEVFERTTTLSTADLVNLSHKKDGPWSKVYNKDDERHIQVISKEDMYIFYKNIDNVFDTNEVVQ